jgi:CYTH domain-containing protein
MEIERKFLVNKQKWKLLTKESCQYILQGYLFVNDKMSVRARIMGEKGYLTIKGKTQKLSREEYEFVIDNKIAKELIEKFTEVQIEKNRYFVEYSGKKWEIDEFLGENAGLIIAEIELNSENEKIEIPDWVEKEVSYDSRYYNSYLAQNPYIYWE